MEKNRAKAPPLRAWLLTITLVLTAVSTAATVRAQDQSEELSVFEVQIEELNEEKKKAEDVISSGFLKKQEAVQNVFRNSLKELNEKLLEVRKNPDSREARDAYEDVLSKSLSDAADYLGELGEEQAGVMGALDRVAGALEETQQLAENRMAEMRAASERRRETIAAASSAIEQLAERFQDQVLNNQPLPEDVEHDVAMLETDLLTAQSLEKLAERELEHAAQQIAALQAQRKEVKAQVRNLEKLFRTAEGQKLILSRIAQLKSQQLVTMKLVDDLKFITTGLSTLPGTMQNVTSLFDRVFDAPVPVLTPGTGMSEANSTSAREILRQALEKKKAAAAQRTAAEVKPGEVIEAEVKAGEKK